jgi:hypothetical protein
LIQRYQAEGARLEKLLPLMPPELQMAIAQKFGMQALDTDDIAPSGHPMPPHPQAGPPMGQPQPQPNPPSAGFFTPEGSEQ